MIFDLDGTIVDTTALITDTMIAVLARASAAVDPAQVRPTIGRPLTPSIARLLGLPPDDERVIRAAAAYRGRFSAAVRERGERLLFPGVRGGLAALRARGLALAVATSKIRASADEVVSATGLGGVFGAVVGHDEVARGKPAPDTALLAAGRLGVPPPRCLVVGDAAVDVLMGRQAGMRVLGAGYGAADPGDLLAAGAAGVAADFPSVIRAILAGTG